LFRGTLKTRTLAFPLNICQFILGSSIDVWFSIPIAFYFMQNWDLRLGNDLTCACSRVE